MVSTGLGRAGMGHYLDALRLAFEEAGLGVKPEHHWPQGGPKLCSGYKILPSSQAFKQTA